MSRAETVSHTLILTHCDLYSTRKKYSNSHHVLRYTYHSNRHPFLLSSIMSLTIYKWSDSTGITSVILGKTTPYDKTFGTEMSSYFLRPVHKLSTRFHGDCM